MKQFFPNISFNRSKRVKYLTLYGLLIVIFGAGAAACFLSGNQMVSTMGLFCVFFILIFAVLIPSVITGNPVKPGPVIEIEGTKVKFNGKEEVKISDVVAVSVCIEVPKQGVSKEEMYKNLKQIASVRPEEPVFGTCDVVCLDKKGKEMPKYNYVEDCIGALEAFVEAGVKKYRIIYSMKRVNCVASYNINLTPSGNSEYDALSEKDRMNQLI